MYILFILVYAGEVILSWWRGAGRNGNAYFSEENTALSIYRIRKYMRFSYGVPDPGMLLQQRYLGAMYDNTIHTWNAYGGGAPLEYRK
jgi:hypothetical protein